MTSVLFLPQHLIFYASIIVLYKKTKAHMDKHSYTAMCEHSCVGIQAYIHLSPSNTFHLGKKVSANIKQ